MEGTADTNPAMKRPMIAPATDGVVPVMTHAMQYIRDAEM
jgi:hypothetical protein